MCAIWHNAFLIRNAPDWSNGIVRVHDHLSVLPERMKRVSCRNSTSALPQKKKKQKNVQYDAALEEWCVSCETLVLSAFSAHLSLSAQLFFFFFFVPFYLFLFSYVRVYFGGWCVYLRTDVHLSHTWRAESKAAETSPRWSFRSASVGPALMAMSGVRLLMTVRMDALHKKKIYSFIFDHRTVRSCVPIAATLIRMASIPLAIISYEPQRNMQSRRGVRHEGCEWRRRNKKNCL
jgi:hypothetical protein